MYVKNHSPLQYMASMSDEKLRLIYISAQCKIDYGTATDQTIFIYHRVQDEINKRAISAAHIE